MSLKSFLAVATTAFSFSFSGQVLALQAPSPVAPAEVQLKNFKNYCLVEGGIQASATKLNTEGWIRASERSLSRVADPALRSGFEDMMDNMGNMVFYFREGIQGGEAIYFKDGSCISLPAPGGFDSAWNVFDRNSLNVIFNGNMKSGGGQLFVIQAEPVSFSFIQSGDGKGGNMIMATTIKAPMGASPGKQ